VDPGAGGGQKAAGAGRLTYYPAERLPGGVAWNSPSPPGVSACSRTYRPASSGATREVRFRSMSALAPAR
jgi:hypothetical protein